MNPSFTDRWQAIGKGRDKATNLPMVLVARERTDVQARLTIWKLVLRPNGWYAVGQWISKGSYRKFPEKNGVKLSDSKTDQTLLHYANYAHNF